jgi:predicted transcriptional regulator
MYSVGVAYLLWLFSGFGALGFHRFYLGKIPTGLLWMFTGGLGMIGSIYDFFTLPGQVQSANIRRELLDRSFLRSNRSKGQTARQSSDWRNKNIRYADDAEYQVINKKGRSKENPERVILKLAQENKGIISLSDLALGADISIEEAKKHLDNMVSKGFAELRVRKSGTLVYVIPDMADKDEPLEDF